MMPKKYRILVVDDEPIYQKMVGRALIALGYEVDFAPSAERGIAAAVALEPDVIITDVIMGEMDGYDFTKKLRRNPKFARTGILMLTVKTDLSDKLQAFEAGADDFLSKPFEPEELSARVSVLIRRSESLAKQRPSEPVVQEEVPKEARIIATHSLRGGIGCTSIAVNLATALFDLWQQPTLVVDSVLTAGQVALMLNLPLKRTWGDIAEYRAENVDYQLIQSIISKHKSGLDVIAAPSSPAVAEMVSSEAMLATIDLLRSYYDYIVIDTPHDFSSVAIHMLDAADIVISLLAPELASVRAAVAAINTYPQLGYNSHKIMLMMNEIFNLPGLRQEQIEKALSASIEVIIPYSPDLFIKAINIGKPFVQDKPRAQVAAVIENMAYSLSKIEHQSKPPINPTPTWDRVNRRLSQIQP